MTLQEERKKMGLSQRQLAEKSGVKLRTLQHREIGDRLPDRAALETLCKLAIALNCEIDRLLVNDDLKELYRKAKKL